MTSRQQTDPWKDLVGHCVSEVLCAPKTWGDPFRPSDMEMPRGLEHIVYYLKRNVVGHPWANHLVLLVAVTCRNNLQYRSVLNTMTVLHRGFFDLFPALDLHTMDDWEVDKHLALYLGKPLLDTHTPYMRWTFWKQYSVGSRHLKRWLSSLPDAQQVQYRPYVFLPPSDPKELAQLSGGKRVVMEQQEKRKAETDAIMPFYMDLRTQAHLRYNLLVRMRKAYHQAIQLVTDGKATLPLEFKLQEGGNGRLKRPPSECLVFRLWDRRTLVLHHPEYFSSTMKWYAQNGKGTYSDEKNTYLLEFVRAEALDDTNAAVGLWFLELLERGVVGDITNSKNQEEIQAKQAWLREQGYSEEGHDKSVPFQADTAGVLVPPLETGDWQIMRNVRERVGKILIPIESFYVAATFGMVALHILTANGMRIAELLQVRASSDCIVPIVLPPAPDAADQTPTIHWEVRAVPKGHRTPKPYYLDDEHLRLLSLVKFMLCEQYGIDPKVGGDLPVVQLRSYAALRFKPDRYPFQYAHRALEANDVRVCMRFLVHGLVFQTLEGRRVTILPHLLRHGFATWALNMAKEPIDIVAAILNQKNFAVTKYYGRPNPRLIAERSHGLMSHISSYIDVEALILRSPEEIRHLILKAQATHGTLAHVRGGRCLMGGECPIFYACIGCSAKAPDPAQRGEVEEVREITLIQIQRAKKKGLTLEVVQLGKKLKQCDAELQEMTMIELCREDEQREPEGTFEIDA
jgi:hypothetical protein